MRLPGPGLPGPDLKGPVLPGPGFDGLGVGLLSGLLFSASSLPDFHDPDRL